MDSDADLDKKYPGWITPKRDRLLYELVLFVKYKRWFPLWFVKLYLIVGYLRSDFWSFIESLAYRTILIIFPLILILALLLIIQLIMKQ